MSEPKPTAQPAHPQDIIAAMDRTPYGEILRDTTSRRRMVFEAMTNSADPLTRELGQQLHSGSIVPRDLLRRPEYREFVARGLAAAGEGLGLNELVSAAQAVAHDGQLTGDPQHDFRQTTPKPERLDASEDAAHQRDRDERR